MKASIIIPVHDEEKVLAETLSAVYRQTYKDIEVIVVCNGCTDSSARVARRFTLNVIEDRKAGVSRARNKGAKAATGDLLLFLDADSLMHPKLVEQAVSAIKKGYVGGTARTLSIENLPKARLMWWLKDKANFVFLTASGNLFCKKDAFPRFREDINLAEDTFVLEALRKQGKVAYLRDTHIRTSMRRHEKEGYLKTIFKVTSGYFYRKQRDYAPVR